MEERLEHDGRAPFGDVLLCFVLNTTFNIRRIDGQHMKTSVLISTFNGEAFIEEQLASLLEQTVQPDEVLIVDDCSTDGTYAKVQAFLAQNQLDGWRLSQNERNRGFRANFRALAEAATGELVFFCDQDDVWGKRKIETCLDVMSCRPDINLLCTDYICSGIRPAEDSLSPTAPRGDRNIEKIRPHKGKPYIWLGCAMAVRASFIREILPYWADDWAHDECVWCMAEASSSCAILHETHLWHRVHGGNATGMKVHEKSRRVALIEEKARGYAETARFCREKGIDGETPRLFTGMSECEFARAGFLKNPTVGKAVRLLRYLPYYLEAKSYPVDVAIALGLVK